ncbi:MAG: hypothetical protein SFX18_19520 [Pirellulales bacterium]|nr:hypothetical protein [Pirellulales bacterium]
MENEEELLRYAHGLQIYADLARRGAIPLENQTSAFEFAHNLEQASSLILEEWRFARYKEKIKTQSLPTEGAKSGSKLCDSSGAPKVAMLYGGIELKGKHAEIERIAKDTTQTVNARIVAIDGILKLPPNVTLKTLAETFGVTRAAIGKTDWWIENRAGKDDENQGRRIQGHKDKTCIPQNHRARNNPYAGIDDSDE